MSIHEITATEVSGAVVFVITPRILYLQNPYGATMVGATLIYVVVLSGSSNFIVFVLAAGGVTNVTQPSSTVNTKYIVAICAGFPQEMLIVNVYTPTFASVYAFDFTVIGLASKLDCVPWIIVEVQVNMSELVLGDEFFVEASIISALQKV